MSVPLVVRLAGFLALAVGASTLIFAFIDGADSAHTPSAVPSAGLSAGTRVRSINVKGLDPTDQFMNTEALQETIKRRNIPYLRIPFRDGWTDTQYTDLVKAVTNAGAIPVVIVPGACKNSLSVSDRYLYNVDIETKNADYYVEYGNEADHSCDGGPGISAATYTAGWNRDVPTLKANHPHAHFIGPVNAGYNGPYIETFMRTASPRPDVVSYHAYVCKPSDTEQACIDAISQWDTFATDLKNRMQNNVGYTTPVWITEWNMDGFDEVRYQQPFIQTWTVRALKEWATLLDEGKIDAAFQYSMSNNGTFGGSCSGFQLFCADGSETLQAKAFFSGI
jgi:putative glycosyl hydrolase